MLTYPICALAQGSKNRQTAKKHENNFYESNLKEIIGIQNRTHEVHYFTTARIIILSLMKDNNISDGYMGRQLSRQCIDRAQCTHLLCLNRI